MVCSSVCDKSPESRRSCPSQHPLPGTIFSAQGPWSEWGVKLNPSPCPYLRPDGSACGHSRAFCTLEPAAAGHPALRHAWSAERTSPAWSMRKTGRQVHVGPEGTGHSHHKLRCQMQIPTRPHPTTPHHPTPPSCAPMSHSAILAIKTLLLREALDMLKSGQQWTFPL